MAEVTITVGGLGVIAAVLGILFYLTIAVLPLFEGARAVVPGLDGRVVALASPGGPGDGAAATDVGSDGARSGPLAFELDDYQNMLMVLDRSGLLRVFEVAHLRDERSSAEPFVQIDIAPQGRTITAFSRDPASGLTAVGYDDGSIQLGTIGFETTFPTSAEVPQAAALTVGGSAVWRDDPAVAEGALLGVLDRPTSTQYRLTRLKLGLPNAVALAGGAGPVVAIDYRARAGTELAVALREDGWAKLQLVRRTVPLGGGQPRVRLTPYDLPLQIPPGRDRPHKLVVLSDGTSVLALWNDGLVQRYATSDPTSITLAETYRALDAQRRVGASAVLLGGLTLLLGDDAGTLHAIFPAVDPSSTTVDGLRLVTAHRVPTGTSPITSIGTTPRDRSVVVGDAGGGVFARNIVSEKRLVDLPSALGTPTVAAAFAPKVDGIVALGSDGRVRTWKIDSPHPESSVKSLFGKVHYEGLPEPAHVYQSSSGEDSSEVKYGLVPLILGTLKATVFAMLFAAPVAVLAAIYTCEFLHPSVRNRVKPVIELMASLPSVVLGFVAAIIVAPLALEHLAGIMAAFAVLPLTVLLFAHVWQVVPRPMRLRVGSVGRIGILACLIAGGCWLSGVVGRVGEGLLFRPSHTDKLVLAGSYEPVPREQWPAWVGGRRTMSPDDERRLRGDTGWSFRDGQVVRPIEPPDPAAQAAVDATLQRDNLGRASFRSWLDGSIGGPFPGWLLVLFLPTLVMLALVRGWVIPSAAGTGAQAGAAAVRELGVFVGWVLVSALVAALFAWLLSALGMDARDFVFGPFSQRNTLVVGLIMGFAVIPIIYTISEDAMSSVPASLRSASLGSGATPWQTAIRIVLPVAASGIFSAVMIGLGRAVGETMIVVMATGNTPSMDWNVFSGFRTLSANIAVELPEAPAQSTHYRVLFLCGLALFVMTFFINTTAEVLRQYFRRRNAAL